MKYTVLLSLCLSTFFSYGMKNSITSTNSFEKKELTPLLDPNLVTRVRKQSIEDIRFIKEENISKIIAEKSKNSNK